MPQLAALTLADGQNTPVNRTFSPVTSNGQKAEWSEKSSGIPSGFQGITLEIRRPTTATGAHRAIFGMNLPVVATVNGVPTVVRFNTAKLELNFSSASSEQERKDTLAFVKNFLSNASVATAITTLEPFY